MSDHIDRATSAIVSVIGNTPDANLIAQALDAAGRLVTTEHDRQVAARAWNEGCAAGLREANDKARGIQNNPAINPYEREAGETDANR